jgi:hypothetical protein
MIGSTVTQSPAADHTRPLVLKTVAKNWGPAINPTLAKKSAIPNSGGVLLVLHAWQPLVYHPSRV